MAKIKKATFNYLVAILRDYHYIDEHIKCRERELRYPHREEDINRDIKGNQAAHDANDNLMITIEQDRRLACLERNKRLITFELDEADLDTQTIIEELYMKHRPRYTMQGLLDSRKIYCSRTRAFELRDEFFRQLAMRFDLQI